MAFGLAGSLASTSLRTASTSEAVSRAIRTSTSTSTSEESSVAFPTSLLRSMSRTTTIIAGAFGTVGTTSTGGSTMRYTPAGAAAIEAVRTSAEGTGIFDGGLSRGDMSLLTPGATDIAADASDTSGIAGLLAGSGSIYDSFRSEMEARITAGSALDSAIDERRSGLLQLTVDRVLTDPREFRARERGSPPVAPEEGEMYVGPESMRLQAAEKPAILAIIEEDIQSNGVAGQVTLIIKKLTSERFRAIEYTIFKKNIFTDSSYDGGATLPGTSGLATSLSPRYTEAAIEAGFSLPNILTYTDPDIEAGRVYAYKVKVVYDGDIDAREEEREETEAMVTAIFGSDPTGPGGLGGSIPPTVQRIFGTGGVTESILSAIGSTEGSTGGGSTGGGSTGGEGAGLSGFSGGGGGFSGGGLPGF